MANFIKDNYGAYNNGVFHIYKESHSCFWAVSLLSDCFDIIHRAKTLKEAKEWCNKHDSWE